MGNPYPRNSICILSNVCEEIRMAADRYPVVTLVVIGNGTLIRLRPEHTIRYIAINKPIGVPY